MIKNQLPCSVGESFIVFFAQKTLRDLDYYSVDYMLEGMSLQEMRGSNERTHLDKPGEKQKISTAYAGFFIY